MAVCTKRRRMSGLDLGIPNPWRRQLSGCVGLSLRRRSLVVPERQLESVRPACGFAYQLHPRLVLRGGYGLNYTAPVANMFGFDNVFGFNGTNNFPASTPAPVVRQDHGSGLWPARDSVGIASQLLKWQRLASDASGADSLRRDVLQIWLLPDFGVLSATVCWWM
jgi:hypothetical protein